MLLCNVRTVHLMHLNTSTVIMMLYVLSSLRYVSGVVKLYQQLNGKHTDNYGETRHTSAPNVNVGLSTWTRQHM